MERGQTVSLVEPVRIVSLFVTGLHGIAFHALLILIALHGLFHLLHPFLLKDCALRIMVPKLLHKYL
ncbi:hypothetical protein [Phaeobacter gallaeciensis]|uniref:Uncharacterized protein n=1 Tax=Phaeobacter gallaeciensis TaxID=60890 RepID=A0AAD0ECE0_9RHOB|nr:hypothetical protein [Phaeobacter gallaeciensis]AHD08962.1 hypothetical protein Gal_01191 [Phaeobacter gallaeciensis DSM 26640]ATE92228.1 hypothetical protein PhaeoP11_01186 [Phaeobacter gallaeciensis]ATE97953.1 hypothetical protein PhaeoP73_02663 [Phaeobacter gallaeciensis]ATF00890.1 hypothetical protein PhaeoP75_01233 [Phaeobacter gallaeciensis]ATF05270.1 hypothetical protein PhaeoP63_01181 [Phaeobacter gallaeciensis]